MAPRRIAALLVLLFLFPLALVHAAPSEEACGSRGAPALGIIQVTGGTASSTFYVDDRNYVTGNGLWMYEESNTLWTPKAAGVYFGDPDHKDLQRNDPHCDFLPCDDPWCEDPTGGLPPDTPLF